MEILEKLRLSLNYDLNVLLAYVFGSQARGSSSIFSDLDLGVLLKAGGFEETYKIQKEIAETLGIPEDKVDVVDLSSASTPLKYRVLKEGVKILDRGGYENLLLEKVSNLYPEIRFLTIDSAYELLGCKDPTSINVDLVNSRVTQLREEILFLKEVLARTLEEILRSEELRRAFERSVEVSIEAMLDVCKHVVTAQGLGVAETYADYVKRLLDNEKIPGELGDELLKLVRWRNVLVHRYMEINYEELHQQAEALRDRTAAPFINWALEPMVKQP